MASQMRDYANEGMVNLVGGCCGTTPDHIRAIAEEASRFSPRQIPEQKPWLRLSGLEPLVIRPETNFVNIGERTKVTGSSVFRDLIKYDDTEEGVKVEGRKVYTDGEVDG